MNATSAVEQSIAAFSLHALWQVPLLTCGAWCAVRLGRPQPRVAHAVWVATLLLSVLMPAGSTFAARQAARAAERNTTTYVSYGTVPFDGNLPSMEREPAWQRVLHRHLSMRDGLQPFAFAMPQRWARILSVAWFMVIAFFSAQLCMGWINVRALVRRASHDPLPGGIAAALQQQCARMPIAPPPAMLHPHISGPVLAGVLRPVLLLPADSTREMASTEIDAVLAHELAHLRRRDPLSHAACSLLLLPVSFHPAALWAARSVRQTREMACDAEAAASMGSRTQYARALMQVAERTTVHGHATAAGLFSNGLFGAGLQLFTNRGAMEERMQMLMNESRGKARGRVARVAAGLSLAAVTVAAATMLQVQPTMAAERSTPQAASATPQITTPALAAPASSAEREPVLIGGDHAREQLRRAHRQLMQAESRATTDEDRRKIEGAQQAIAAAEQALIAAGGSSRTHVDLSGLDQLNVQLKDLKLPDAAALQAQITAQHEAMAKLQAQMNSPEWKAQMDGARKAMEAARAQMNSPEFKAQMDSARRAAEAVRIQTNSPEWKAQIDNARKAMEAARAQMNSPEFKAQMEEARKLDRVKIEAMMAEARKQQEKAMEQFRSGALQRQIEEARLMARNEGLAPLPAPATASPTADQQSAERPVKINSGIMAGNKISGADPVYPADAKEKHAAGTVVLQAIIDKAGKVEAVRVVTSPDDSLSKSAVAAVQTWVYRPYLLNGEPVAVDTTVNVNYTLAP